MPDSAPVLPLSQAPVQGCFLDDILNRFANVPYSTLPASETEEPAPCPAPKELPEGHILNGYRLRRCVGSGGFGVTYLADDELLRRRVVIKEHFPHNICERRAGSLNVELQDPSAASTLEWARSNFLREAHLLSRLDHHNIVKIFTFFEAHNTLYYVTEYVDGQSLGDFAQAHYHHKTRISQDELYGLMVRMLDALDYLHSLRILHLDIKPDNILLNRSGRPVLIDFGAAHESFGDQGGGVVETVGYSPPEQSGATGDLGPWSDIYAFGATLCYLLTGKAPDSGRQRLLYDSLEPLASSPLLCSFYNHELLSSIDRALSPSIEGRYRSVAEWMNDLRAK